MLRNLLETRQPDQAKDTTRSGADRRLQAVLWTLWTLAVVATAFWQWYMDAAAGGPIDLLGIVIYALLAGTIGLVVLTMIEIWLEPQRFID
jgi:hypothetical protein